MNELVIIYILTFVLVVLLPLFGLLMKDGSRLFRDVKKALEDGKLTDAEIDTILADTGKVLRTVVIIVEAVLRKLGKL